MATPLEKDIERALGRMIGKHGGRCLKWVCPGWLGVPDRICLLPGGRIYFVETKRPKGSEIGKMQEKWRDWLVALGFVHRFVFTHEDVKALELLIWEGEVRWYRPGYCPVTPEQFVAIYNNGEEDV